ncbi:MAG: malate dehydrogenase [Dehalococcoidaceae bacterium]|nr:malate dehydrogenase [Dehalococcoidaceae bacterium]
MQKVTIVGAGNVGATAAQRLVEKNLCDVVLLDIVEGLPQGKALDIAHSAHVLGVTSRITGTNDYADTAGSDIVIITSGAARKPGMTRDQLTGINVNIVSQVVAGAAQASPSAVILMVTNPVDAMTWLAIKKSGFEPHRVIGLSGVLDSSRLAYLISRELKVPVTDVTTWVLGEHGQEMVVIPRLNSVRGVPITKMLPDNVIATLVERTVGSGAEVVSFLKTGSAYYAPSAAVIRMAEAVLKDSHEILPCAAYIDGQYGLKDVCLGVPVRLGRQGIEGIIELDLTPAELKRMAKSARAVKQLIKQASAG